MAKEKSLVEDAIIQMRNLEEAVAENAKGILGSVMSKEIKELVKESLLEQEDDIEDEEEEVSKASEPVVVPKSTSSDKAQDILAMIRARQQKG